MTDSYLCVGKHYFVARVCLAVLILWVGVVCGRGYGAHKVDVGHETVMLI